MLFLLRLFSAFRALESEVAALKQRLEISQDSLANSSQQLMAERALRQAADERVQEYFEELNRVRNRFEDWMALQGSRRRIHGEEPATTGESERKPQEVPGKRMARSAIQEINGKTVADYLKDMQASIENGGDELPVGPEFAAGA